MIQSPSPANALPLVSKNEELILQLRYFFALLLRYYKQILGFSGLVTFVSILVALSLTPIYQATTTILIEPLQSKTVSVEEIVRVDRTRRSYYKTQYEVLRSRKISEMVAEDLQLANHPLFNPDGLQSSELNKQLAGTLVGNLSIYPLVGTQLVNISYRSSDPVVAAQVANAFFQAYIENHLESNLSATVKAQTWLSKRLSKLKLKLEESERKLQLFSEQENLLDVKGVKSIAVSQLEQLTAQLIEVRQKKAAARNTYEQLSKLPKNSTQELLSISAILNQPIIQELKSQESALELKIVNLSSRYGPLHPKMKTANSELKSVREKLVIQVGDLVGTYQNELETVTQMESSVLSQIENSNREVKRINNKSYELAKLAREVEVNKELYDLFLTREKETLGISGFEAAHARVIDTATVPTSPIAPHKKLIVILSFLLALVLACGLIILYDLLDNTIKTPNDVEQKLASSLLGILPLAKSAEITETSGAYRGFIEDKMSSFAESVRTIRTGLLLSSLEADEKIIVVSSSLPAEGKSTVACNLAATLGQMNKTLLIDADLRRPSMGITFGISQATLGLSSVIAGESKLEDCLSVDVTEGVDLLVAGIIPSNPLELLSSSQFSDFIKGCSKQYKNIVIDSAPVQSVSDSLVLSQLANLFVYVVKADSTKASLARKGLERLKQANAPLSGVVLNQVDMESNAYYGDDYYGGYYQSIPYGSVDNTANDEAIGTKPKTST